MNNINSKINIGSYFIIYEKIILFNDNKLSLDTNLTGSYSIENKTGYDLKKDGKLIYSQERKINSFALYKERKKVEIKRPYFFKYPITLNFSDCGPVSIYREKWYKTHKFNITLNESILSRVELDFSIFPCQYIYKVFITDFGLEYVDNICFVLMYMFGTSNDYIGT